MVVPAQCCPLASAVPTRLCINTSHGQHANKPQLLANIRHRISRVSSGTNIFFLIIFFITLPKSRRHPFCRISLSCFVQLWPVESDVKMNFSFISAHLGMRRGENSLAQHKDQKWRETASLSIRNNISKSFFRSQLERFHISTTYCKYATCLKKRLFLAIYLERQSQQQG